MCSWTAFTPPNAAPPSVFPPANKVLMSATAALIVDTGLVHSIPNESKVALSPGLLKFRIRFYCCSGL